MSAGTADSGLIVVIQDLAGHPGTPSEAFMKLCLSKVFGARSGELAVRVVAESESAALNERYRGKPGPTNVLAFEAADWPVHDGEPAPLGDIVICAAVVAREAAEQGKGLEAHWAHMLIHGGLHLQGHDHETTAEAAEMEGRERELLSELGIADPYRDEA